MDLEPSFDVLVVEEIKPDEKTESGLFIPGAVTERDTLMKARILKAGPGQTNRAGQLIPHEYSVGEVIVFDKMRCFPVSYNGKPYLFINAHQVFAKVKEPSKILEN